MIDQICSILPLLVKNSSIVWHFNVSYFHLVVSKKDYKFKALSQQSAVPTLEKSQQYCKLLRTVVGGTSSVRKKIAPHDIHMLSSGRRRLTNGVGSILYTALSKFES